VGSTPGGPADHHVHVSAAAVVECIGLLATSRVPVALRHVAERCGAGIVRESLMVLAFLGQPKHYTETFMRRWGAKRDSNENAIVDSLEGIGVYVVRLNQPAMPDLLCWTQREGLRLIEVKMPGEKLTVLQQTTRRYLPFAVVTNEAEALALFGVVA
jgi:hypothetical protein